MKANELRIGNTIMSMAGIVTVRSINDASDGHYIGMKEFVFASNISEFSGIPLTEEWLLKFGFKYQRPGIGGQDSWAGYGFWQLPNNEFNLIGTKSGTVYFNRCWDWQIKHVHQLQNLYFALTGTELCKS
jgi:hypothetical protein